MKSEFQDLNTRSQPDQRYQPADITHQRYLLERGYPAWSPDGAKIVFYSDRDGASEIYVMNADGPGQTRLTNNPSQDLLPALSPDGAKIAFVSNRDGTDLWDPSAHEIYVMNADGSNQTRLTNNTWADSSPTWSP